MITQSSKNHKIKEADIYRLEVQNQKTQKLKARMLNLQKTPNAHDHNPYIEQIGDRSTSKKHRQTSISYKPPILIDQNKQLISENRQMSILLNQKNAEIQALQLQMEKKAQNQINIYKEIQIQKKRFIQEILEHKEATDLQIAKLSQEINKLQDEKQEIQKNYHLQLKKKQVYFQQEHQRQSQRLKLEYHQMIDLTKTENLRLKEQIQKKNNEIRIKQLQSKQKIMELTSKRDSLIDQLKHLQQVQRLQQAQSKMQYQSKIQKIHLQHRRQKQLFLMQHESHVKRSNEQIKRLKRQIEQLQDKITVLNETVEKEQDNKDSYQQKMHYQAETNIAAIKSMNIQEREKLESLLKAEMNVMETFTSEQIRQITIQNKKLFFLLDVKQKEIQRLLKQIDGLRGYRIIEIEQNEKMMRELQSKLFTTLLEGQAESQALKVKLAHLRQADITGLRQYHENQLQNLSRTLHQKQCALANARQKLHDQLRKKIEMRKYFDLQSIKYKTRIIELQNQIDLLKVRQSRIVPTQEKQAYYITVDTGKQQTSKSKFEQLNQCKQLQSIINSKDAQIQELNSRLEMLKENQNLERLGWQSQMRAEREQLELARAEKLKNIQGYLNEIAKLKEIIKKEKQDFQKDFNQLKKQHRSDFDDIMVELSNQKANHLQQKRNIQSDLKKRQLQIQRLNLLIKQKDQQIYILKNVAHQQTANEFSRQKQSLQQFYNQQIRIKQGEITDLKERIQELTSDLRDARQNYNDLQRKMEQLIESQSSLRELERKVIHIGKENNLTKNKHEITK